MTPARLVTAVVATFAGSLMSLGLVCAPATAQVPVEDAGSTATPLTVQLSGLSPGVIPKKGRLTLTGTVTNDSDEIWQAVNADPFIGSSPITTRAGLAAAALTPATAEVGPRLTGPSLFAPLGDLAPGQSAHFRISLPRSVLPHQPGVYWIGVHALGANAQGRDDRADGRARTFVALLPPKASTAMSVVLPIRTTVRRTPQGRVADPGSLLSQIGPGGPLNREIAFGASANRVPGQQVTWLVDPAVLDAVQDLADGNPAFQLGEPAPDSSTTPAPGPTPSPTPAPGAGSDAPPDPNPLTAAQRTLAKVWLGHALAAMRGHPVLGLPYADADVAAVGRVRPRLLAQAVRLSALSFTRLEMAATPAVAPPGGWLDDSGLGHLTPGTVALLSDHGSSGRRTLWDSTAGPTIVLGDARAASGGPGPTNPLDPLALRQRILADAALRAAGSLHNPMVVTLPTGWDPGQAWRRADFFGGLAQPWLTQDSLAADLGPLPSYPHRLRYPAAARRAEIGAVNVDTARALMRTGTVLGHLLDTQNTIADALTGAGLAAASYDARGDQQIAQAQVQAIDGNIRRQMSGVVVSGTDFVTLSGLQGRLTVSLANNLREPVTVGIQASAADGQVTIRPARAVTIAAGDRTTVRLYADASTIGVHQVELHPVTRDGERLGTPLTLTLRTSEVGRLIWIILIVAGSVLVIAILRRIYLRIRSHQWRQA